MRRAPWISSLWISRKDGSTGELGMGERGREEWRRKERRGKESVPWERVREGRRGGSEGGKKWREGRSGGLEIKIMFISSADPKPCLGMPRPTALKALTLSGHPPTPHPTHRDDTRKLTSTTFPPNSTTTSREAAKTRSSQERT